MLQQLYSYSLRLRYKWLSRITAFFLALILSLSLSTPSYGFPWLDLLFRGVQILQLSNLSDRQEVTIGSQIEQQLLRQGQIRPVRDRQLQNYLNEIGQRMAKESARSNIPYRFRLIQDDNINAFATMGGFIYINSGLMLAAENEAELASVVGHEIAHIAARHAVNQMRDVALSQGLMTAAGVQQDDFVRLGVQLAFNLPNSRGAELEADQLGLENLENAGYAPIGMIGFMNTLLQRSQGAPPSFLSTHPASTDRIRALKARIDPDTAFDGDGLDGDAYRQRIQRLASNQGRR